MGISAANLARGPSALTSDGEKFDYVYNPWGQLVRIVGLGGDPVTKAVAVYTYSAMGHRISEQLDTNDGGNSGMADTVVDSNDPVFYIATDPSGRRLATYRDLDSDPKESFIHHDARIRGPVHQGVGGGPILRDRNASLAAAPEEWASVGAEAERYERHYYLLDYRGYVSAIITSDAKLVEQVRYSATGVPFNIPLGDVNADGKVESGGGGNPDFDDINGMIGYPLKYHVRGDLDLDGDVDVADRAIAQARDGTGTGRGVRSTVEWRHSIVTPYGEYDTQNRPFAVSSNGAFVHLVLNLILAQPIGPGSPRDPVERPVRPRPFRLTPVNPNAPLEFEPPPETVGMPCQNQDNDWCNWMCETVKKCGSAGFTIRDDATDRPTGCCICNRCMRDRYPDPDLGVPGSDPLPMIIDCIEEHEQTHMRQCGGDTACKECEAYTVELACLTSKLDVCLGASDPLAKVHCWSELQRRIDDVRSYQQEFCRVCDYTPVLPAVPCEAAAKRSDRSMSRKRS